MIDRCNRFLIILSTKKHTLSKTISRWPSQRGTRRSAVAETARCFVSPNISPSHSFEMTPLSRACVSPDYYSNVAVSLSSRPTVSEIFSVE